jgi:hypothetical protein
MELYWAAKRAALRAFGSAVKKVVQTGLLSEATMVGWTDSA